MPVSDQGSSKNRYTLIPRTLIFLQHGGEVLLIKGAPHKRLWANLYNGIGGHVEPGEDIYSAAARELYEETGLCAALWLCGTITIDTGQNPGIMIFVFCGDRISGTLQASEEGALEWIAVDRLNALPMVEDFPVLLPKVLATRRDVPPFFARYWYEPSGKLAVAFSPDGSG